MRRKPRITRILTLRGALRTVWLGLAVLLAVGGSGCLAAAVGAAAGGAAAGYLYYEGNVERDYAADPPDVRAAAHKALAELQMPVESETVDGTDATIVSRTADNDKVTIKLSTHPSAVQAEGNLTKVGIRVAIFGDDRTSNRVHDQINLHLAVAPGRTPLPPPPPAPGGVVQTGGTAPLTPQPAPPSQTGPPPLAK
jgi:hypothetical protein